MHLNHENTDFWGLICLHLYFGALLLNSTLTLDQFINWQQQIGVITIEKKCGVILNSQLVLRSTKSQLGQLKIQTLQWVNLEQFEIIEQYQNSDSPARISKKSMTVGMACKKQDFQEKSKNALKKLGMIHFLWPNGFAFITARSAILLFNIHPLS